MEPTLLRQWSMLRRIPRYPRKVTATDLCVHLRSQGFEVTVRSVQRDLAALETPFALSCDDRSKPYGWFWREGIVFDLPGMDPTTALTFSLARLFLGPLLPRSALARIEPHFARAGELLAEPSGFPYAGWPEKVRILPRGLKLQPPEVNTEVLDTVYQALFEERRFAVEYKPREATKSIRYEVNPLGLVVRDGVLYLVCTLWGYDDLKQLVLHRMKQSELLKTETRKPAGFDLDAYIRSGAFAAPFDEGTFCLEAVFDPGCALHLRETRLSQDQQLVDLPDGRVRLSATVPNTGELRWWLLGFGAGVEVVAPEGLRAEFAATARSLAERYR